MSAPTLDLPAAAGLLTPPAHVSVPATRRGSLVEVVDAFAARAGRRLDDEQRFAVDVLTSVDEAGLWAAPVGVILEPRQNGKSAGVLAPIVLSELFDEDYPDRIVWTAHRFKTAREAYLDLRAMVKGTPELDARVERYNDSHGEEGIYLRPRRPGAPQASLEFLARSNLGSRGLGGKVVVFDEAFALTQGILGALLPTLSARYNPLVLAGSSACMGDSVELWDLVESVRRGDPDVAGVEWCAPGGFDAPGCELAGCLHTRGTPGCSLDDEDRWRAANPGMRRGRLTERFVRTVERARLSPVEFGRERLGWHEKVVDRTAPPITVAAWRARTDEDSAPVGEVVFAVEAPLSKAWASITVSGYREDGAKHVGIIDRRAGTDWVVPRLVQLCQTWDVFNVRRGDEYRTGIAIDPTSPALGFVQPLEDAGYPPVLMTTREVAAACSMLETDLRDGLVFHRDAPDVDVALEGAVRRDLGDGLWAFGRRKSAAVSVEVDPAVAVANASWLLSLVPPPVDVGESMF